MRLADVTAKVLLSLVLLAAGIGSAGLLPAPTADLYNTPEAWNFIQAVMTSGYINPVMAVVFFASLLCLWTKRTALAALLLLPITVNVAGFHLFLDAGLFTPGAIMADILLITNAYFLWQNKEVYKALVAKRA